MIHLVGPGAAGKSTVGAVLASGLRLSFLDLDVVFRERAGDISQYSEEEEAVIRERYSIYMALPAAKVETMRPVDEVVDEIASAVGGAIHCRG